MLKKYLMFIILVIVIVGISGCTTKTATNGTFGEKIVSINSIFISDNTTADHEIVNNTKYYYIQGYLVNNNSNDAFKVKLNATAYDANGNVVAINNSAYLDPPTISAKSVSFLFIRFNDPDEKIVRYDVKVVSAQGSYN